MSDLERCRAEQAACTEYLSDPAKLAAHAREMRCTVEQERFGALLGWLDWTAEAELVQREMEARG